MCYTSRPTPCDPPWPPPAVCAIACDRASETDLGDPQTESGPKSAAALQARALVAPHGLSPAAVRSDRAGPRTAPRGPVQLIASSAFILRLFFYCDAHVAQEAKTSRKRYEEDDVDFEPELDLDGGDALLPASTRRASAVVLKAVEAAPDASISDDEGDALLRTTEHIWTLPVQSYLLQQSIKRQKLARDFGANEQSRHYLIACRVLEMSERRQGEMREAKTRRMVDGVLVEEGRLHELQLESSKAEREEEKRLAKEREREERLRKQREGARKRREEERLKKDHDDEHRRVRAEEARLAKQLEVQRRALLNPEQRAAEDAIAQEKAQRDREARAARTLEDDLLGISEGRGARKKRRTEGGDGLEGDRAGYDDGTGEYDGEYDEMDDFGDIYGSPGPSGRVKGKATPRRAYEGAEYYAGAYEQFGAYQQQPYTPPTSPHQSGYGSLLDDTPLPSDHEMDENLRRLELPSSLSDPTERAAAVEALERKLWTQIARRDIPKVRATSSTMCRTNHTPGGATCKSEHDESTLVRQATFGTRRPRGKTRDRAHQGCKGRADPGQACHARGTSAPSPERH